jgi:FMN phosphatase YigB (HAD superfamily)/8-oxo-dGTP pyrophosphatase MutT (NUDIX family)
MKETASRGFSLKLLLHLIFFINATIITNTLSVTRRKVTGLQQVQQRQSSSSSSLSTTNFKAITMQDDEKKNKMALLGFTDTTNSNDLIKALQDGTTLNANENVCTVDENNNPTSTGHPRSQMRLNKMWHRATYIIIRYIDPNNSINNNNDEVLVDDDDDEEEQILLVQRRSTIKDYCPGKLDATPGGVVGFGESYLLNSTREMMEEMNIDLEDDKNEMKQLFVFPYEDESVKVWGGLFEVTYRKPYSEIKMQPEEVSEVIQLPVKTIRKMAIDDPDDWMPDGLHAIKLYLQYRYDTTLKRRWGNIERYSIRPKPEVILFDCDDCLYFDGWKLASKLTAKIEEWCTSKKNLPAGEAYQLYKKHGTALKGLLAEGHMDETEEEIDQYLSDVHDIPIHEHLSIDNELRDMILKIDPTIPKYIFTASVRAHAERCLRALGIDDLFVDIIDGKLCYYMVLSIVLILVLYSMYKNKIHRIYFLHFYHPLLTIFLQFPLTFLLALYYCYHSLPPLLLLHVVKSCNLATKHSTEAFEAALKIAGVKDPETCLFLDDSTKNIATARSLGIRSFLVGRVGRDCGKPITSDHAEHEIDIIHDFPNVMPEIFIHD